jgi:phosphoglucomutase
MSTPALSCVIRKRKTDGGIILTASHNPGGPKGDFGMKFNMENGGPAPTEFTDLIFQHSKKISTYKICNDLVCDVGKTGSTVYEVNGNKFEVEVIDSFADYVEMMKNIFDFDAISCLP